MARDPDVVFLGEDVARAGGVFKATVGLFEQFGPLRVRDTPISEQAILGAAMGAAMTGLKPIAEIMFSDFLAVCFDFIANEIPKSRYMSNGQLKCPLVVRTGNGAGSGFGARTHRLFTVEENPRLCGWGAEIVSIVADEAFYDLDGPPVRITTPHIPLPAADALEDIVLPTVDRIAATVRRSLQS